MAQKNQTQKLVSHTFVRRAPDAKKVLLAGAFNGWDPASTPMRKKENGVWTVTLDLAPGRYEYKFVIDGEWRREEACEESDRGCPHCVPNPFGSMNCVVNIS